MDAVLFFAIILTPLPLPPAPAWTRRRQGLAPTPNPPAVWRECDLCQKQEFYMRVVTFSENLVSVTPFKGYHKWYPAKGSVDRKYSDSRLTLHAKACAAGSTRFAIPAAQDGDCGPPGCWLLAAGYWLLVAGCWLLVAGCWLLG